MITRPANSGEGTRNFYRPATEMLKDAGFNLRWRDHRNPSRSTEKLGGGTRFPERISRVEALGCGLIPITG